MESKKKAFWTFFVVCSTGKAIDSDHYIEFLDLNLEFTKEKPQREEIFNFKVNKSQEAFKILTSETKEFTNCFNGKKPLLQKIEEWRKVLKKCCSKTFKRIRIRNNRTKPVNKRFSDLIDKKNELVKKGASEIEIDEVNIAIAEAEADENRAKIMKEFQYFSENPENINSQKMWKSLKIFAQKSNPFYPVLSKIIKVK